ncbi:arylalkylamine N-acetyltransferase 1-like, partial [Bacillus rossius redtenbacheri]|uniref:arylalkylamine N-acetyltransferase 1-like n=1 Tax=Bacillus rossius redtenbacheri TaxID=93214 RepID=UPI002FDDEB72
AAAAAAAAEAGDFRVQPVGGGDRRRVVDFLRQFFFKDEPLNVDVQLLGADGADRCLELEEYSTGCLDEGLSVAAINASTGQLVGVCLNGLDEPGHLPEMEAKVAGCKNTKFRKILGLLASVEQGADIFTRFPDVRKVLEVRIMSVDASWRGRGIAKALLDRSRELAKEKGFDMLRVDCTSHFSARAVERLGMTCVHTLPYARHLGEDGEPVFRPAPPHAEVKTYVERLGQ